MRIPRRGTTRWAAAALLWLLLPGLAAAGDGWIPLLEGGAAAHWRAPRGAPFPAADWEAEGGELRAMPKLLGSDLISRERFAGFELEFGWRVSPGGNSGVKYLVDEARRSRYERPYQLLLIAWFGLLGLGAGWVWISFSRGRSARRVPGVVWLGAFVVLLGAGMAGAAAGGHYIAHHATGLEMQLLDDQRHRNGRVPEKRAGALYGILAPEESPAHEAGIWNTGRIVVDAGCVEHWINGVKVVAYDLRSPDLARALRKAGWDGVTGLAGEPGGHIVLQHHHDEVWFRDVRIRRLPAR